jgi:hypothetical protein
MGFWAAGPPGGKSAIVRNLPGGTGRKSANRCTFAGGTGRKSASTFRIAGGGKTEQMFAFGLGNLSIVINSPIVADLSAGDKPTSVGFLRDTPTRRNHQS